MRIYTCSSPPKCALAQRGHTVPPPLSQTGLGVTSSAPPAAMGRDPPNPSCCRRRGWGAEPPPGFPFGARFRWQSQEAAVPTAGTEQMSPRPPGTARWPCPRPSVLPWVPPFPSGTSGGAAAAPPELRRYRRDGAAPAARGGDSDGGVTVVPGEGGTQHPPLPRRFLGPAGGSNVPPGLPLRLPAPLSAAVYSPGPWPLALALSLSPPHRPPGGDAAPHKPPGTPR